MNLDIVLPRTQMVRESTTEQVEWTASHSSVEMARIVGQSNERNCTHCCRYFFAGMYFQSRALPSESHWSDFARRAFRVSSRFASVIHSMYSRRWLGEKFSNVLRAFAFFFNAAVKSAGIGNGLRFFGCVRPGALTPALLSAAAFFT